MRYIKGMIILIIVVAIGVGVWVWSGTYNIGADSPHWAFTRYVIGKVRGRSIATRTADIKVPDLDDPALLAEGAHHYAHMCTGCHLAPGMGDSELRQGLYPKPPNLTHFAPPPAVSFWVIKHGIKMTAMPAWGKTHSDQKIWAMVAYLQKQPHMSVERYRQLAGLHGQQGGGMHDHGHAHENMDRAPNREPATSATPAAATPPTTAATAPSTVGSPEPAPVASAY